MYTCKNGFQTLLYSWFSKMRSQMVFHNQLRNLSFQNADKLLQAVDYHLHDVFKIHSIRRRHPGRTMHIVQSNQGLKFLQFDHLVSISGKPFTVSLKASLSLLPHGLHQEVRRKMFAV